MVARLKRISFLRWGVIVLLVETGGLTGRDLAEQVGIGASAVTALVDRLVQRDYVRREDDQTDRRVSWARPTERATELFERLHATHRERLAEVLVTLSSEELAQVAQAITTLELAATRQAGVASIAAGMIVTVGWEIAGLWRGAPLLGVQTIYPALVASIGILVFLSRPGMVWARPT